MAIGVDDSDDVITFQNSIYVIHMIRDKDKQQKN